MSTRTHNSIYGSRRARDYVGLSVGGWCFFTLGGRAIRNTPSPSFQRCKRDTEINQKSENKVESLWNGRERKFFSSATGRAFWTIGEMGSEWKSRAQGGSGYLRSGLVSVSGVLVLGVLTLDYRVKVKSVNRKRANKRKSDAGFQVLLHHDSEKG